jgi:nucleoside-diphosphate-sugar epimerase
LNRLSNRRRIQTANPRRPRKYFGDNLASWQICHGGGIAGLIRIGACVRAIRSDDPQMSKHLLLIGHGYLGAAVAVRFRAAGWRVTPVSLSGGDGSLACDVSDAEAVARLPLAEAIVHCAASGRGGVGAYQQVYLDGCANLTNAFPGVPLLFTSSTSVYGQTDGSMVTETSPAEPDRETGRLLLAAENVVLDAGGYVARLSGIYGPGRSVILRKFLTGEAVIEEDGRRFLNQIHRDDAAEAAFHLLANGAAPGIYNVSDSAPLSQRECYEALARVFLLPMPPSGPRDLARKRGWTHKRVSNEKLRATGWVPEFPCFIDAIDSIRPTGR